MRTGRSLTVFRSLLFPGGVWSGGVSGLVPGGSGPGGSGPGGEGVCWSGIPLCEQNDRQVWKYYLGQNFVSAGNELDLKVTMSRFLCTKVIHIIVSRTQNPSDFILGILINGECVYRNICVAKGSDRPKEEPIKLHEWDNREVTTQ